MSGFHYTEFSKTGSILLNAEERDELFGYIDRLRDESAELRELCGELYHELYAARDEHWPALDLGDLEPRDVFPRYDELVEMGVDA